MAFWWIFSVIFIAFLIAVVFTLYTADGDASLLAAERFGRTIDLLEGKIVWVTGASYGIGEELALWLARAGCKLVLSARSKQHLQSVKEKCIRDSKLCDADIMVLPLDVTDYKQHGEATKTVLAHFEKIDILVNNAGRGQRGLASTTSIEVDQAMLDVNVMGPISLTKAVLPHMMKRKLGHICVTSSVNGVIAAANETMYDATKFALHGFFKALRMEMYAYNINVSLLCPGPVFSKLQEEAFTNTAEKKYGIAFGPGDKRMDTSRCAYLMAVAMANTLDEAWISEHPILAFTYLGQYMPTVYTWITKNFGRLMNKMLQSGGKKTN